MGHLPHSSVGGYGSLAPQFCRRIWVACLSDTGLLQVDMDLADPDNVFSIKPTGDTRAIMNGAG